MIVLDFLIFYKHASAINFLYTEILINSIQVFPIILINVVKLTIVKWSGLLWPQWLWAVHYHHNFYFHLNINPFYNLIHRLIKDYIHTYFNVLFWSSQIGCRFASYFQYTVLHNASNMETIWIILFEICDHFTSDWEWDLYIYSLCKPHQTNMMLTFFRKMLINLPQFSNSSHLN